MLFGFHIIAAYCQCYVHSLKFVNHKKSLPLVTGCFPFLPEVLESVVSPCGAALVGLLYKRLEILPLRSQYIFFTLLFVVKNNDLFTMNQEIYNINTRSNTNVHTPLCKLMVVQKGVYSTGIKLYNHVPST